MRVATKTITRGASLLKRLVKKLDTKGNKDGKVSFFERNTLQGTKGSSAEAILVVDHLRSSGVSRGFTKIAQLLPLVDAAKNDVRALDRNKDGFITDAELTKLPRSGRNLARALIEFSTKHKTASISDFKLTR
jgi:hypothetical protein